MDQTVSTRALSALFRPALSALWLYWPAFLLIQICAISLVIGSRLSPEVRAFCATAAEWQAAGGLLFAALANILSGGVVPEILKLWLRPPGIPRPTVPQLVHQWALFAILGVMVNRFYALQSGLFGDGAGWSTVIVKVMFDQFCFTPFIALPLVVVWFIWREQGYRPAATWRASTLPVIAGRGAQIYAVNLLFWIPTLFSVYSMPGEVQFPLFLIVNAAWGLLLIFIARRQVES